MVDTTSFLENLAWRGLLHQHTESAAAALDSASVSGYVGFDPTGSSLHIGHLVPVMGLVHLQRSGHRPIVLVGGGTGMIGDPSGRSAERNLITVEQTAQNAESIRKQLERFLDFSGPYAARMRNNADWLLPLKMIDFLRDVGKHFTVNYMTQKDSVKSRMESGISYTEFSYMLLQAFDYLELYRREGATLQLGGSDQWGNITAGTELIRKSLGAESHAVTLTLVTGADGKKFGKTAEGTSVWLDPARTSPYRFYQYWVNVDDRDASKYLRMFTLKAREEIEAIEQVLAEQPEGREAQAALAMDVTSRVHGDVAAAVARDVSRVLFDRKADPRALDLAALSALRAEIPFAQISGAGASDGSEHGINILGLLTDTGLAKSRGEARRQVQQGAVTVNGRRIGGEEMSVPLSQALHGSYFLVRKGARDVGLAHVAGSVER